MYTDIAGLETAIAAKSVERLERMYHLFSRVDGLKLLCEEFKINVQVSLGIDVCNHADSNLNRSEKRVGNCERHRKRRRNGGSPP